MPFDGFTNWIHDQDTARAARSKAKPRRLWVLAAFMLLLCGIAACICDTPGYLIRAHGSSLAPGIVTAWPRPPKGGSGSYAVALSRDGGRVEPGGPERAGRKNRQRVRKTPAIGSTAYHYDLAGNLIGEANANTGANLTEYVWMEGHLLAQIDNSGTIYYVHSTQINTPQKITNSSMTLVWDYGMYPFGGFFAAPTNTYSTNHRFPGQYEDSGDRLHYNNMREYDPSIGRYIEADPIGLAGGLNLYGYAGQNPTQGIDPSGLSTIVFIPGNPDGTGDRIGIVDQTGIIRGIFPAGNKVARSAPAGQWPAGTFPYTGQNTHESDPNGPYGEYGIFVFDAPQCNHGGGCGVHSGREDSGGPNHATNGCIRSTDDATGMVQDLNENGDPLTTLIVLPQQSYEPGYDPLLHMYPNSSSTPAPGQYTPAPLDY